MEYGIKGVIVVPYEGNSIFEGMIKQISSDGDFHGRLEDSWGPSVIRGTLGLEELTFEKNMTKGMI